MDLIDQVYRLSSKLPSSETYGLISQMRRAAVSSLSNLVEGLSRSIFKDRARFMEISYGSIVECNVQIEIGIRLRYLNSEDCDQVFKTVVKSAKIVSGLRRHFISKSG